MGRNVPIFAVLAALLIFAQVAGAKAVDERIYIVPAGDIDRKVLSAIKEGVAASLPIAAKIEICKSEAMPEGAYNASRKQYNADAALGELSRGTVLIPSMECALFVADADLWSGELNFVFGLANPSKVTSIISLTRLRNEYYGLKQDNALFIKRAVKEAIHELGHGWGLSHCSDRRCVMYFSNSLRDTDDKRAEFCHACRRGLKERYGKSIADIMGKKNK
jgi:archaemetzincin